MRSTTFCLKHNLKVVRNDYVPSLDLFGEFLRQGRLPILMHVAAIVLSEIKHCDTGLT